MQDKYVTNRMIDWGVWILRRDNGALGLPSQSIYTRMVANGGVGSYVPGLDSDAMEVDSILCQIKKSHPRVFTSTHLYYGVDFREGRAVVTHTTSMILIGQRLGIHRDTVDSDIIKAHRLMMDGFHENDVRGQMPLTNKCR